MVFLVARPRTASRDETTPESDKGLFDVIAGVRHPRTQQHTHSFPYMVHVHEKRNGGK